MVAKSAIYVAALAAVAQSVAAHSIVTSVWVNGEDTADASIGVGSSYMRDPKTNSPVEDVTSANMACNINGKTAVSGFLTVAPGDTIEPEWYHTGDRGADPIDPSHNGPLTTWIAPLESNGEGDVWVEIASEAYYSSSKQWAVAKMIANKGRNTVTIPSTLAPGDYLVRFELLALHSAGQYPGAQFYPNCAQITVSGKGSQKLPAGVSIPGFHTAKTPGVVWNIYYSTEYDITGDYVAPGTGVWDGSATYSTDTCTQVVDGLAPAGYCQGGNNSTAPVTTSKPATTSVAVTTSRPAVTSSAAVTTSAAGSSSAVVVPSSSQAASSSPAVTTSKTPTSVPIQQPSTTSVAAPSTTSSAADSTYTDYNSCMRAYNKCLDAHQPKSGGAADFSECYASFQCSNLRMRRSVAPKQLHGRDRVVRRAH